MEHPKGLQSHRRTAVHSLLLAWSSRLSELLIEFLVRYVSETLVSTLVVSLTPIILKVLGPSCGIRVITSGIPFTDLIQQLECVIVMKSGLIFTQILAKMAQRHVTVMKRKFNRRLNCCLLFIQGYSSVQIW